MNEMQLKEIRSLEFEYSLDIQELDIRVKGLIDNLDIKGKKILDSSCYEGLHSCQLAEAGAEITASDIRPQNIKKTLYRALYKGLDIRYRMIDLEEMHNVIKKDEYDIHFFSGSFYHLSDPISVLERTSKLFEYVLLETHIAEERHQPQYSFFYGKPEKLFKYYNYNELGWNDPRSSKDNSQSMWLTKESLLNLFEICNLEIVKTIYDDLYNPHGLRVCYLLKRGEER